MSDWFYAKGESSIGPMTWEELVQLAANGHVRSNDLVWTQGMDQWAQAGTFPALIPDMGGMPAPMAIAALAPDAPIGYFTPSEHPSFAGFWLRVLAFIIDLIILELVLAVINFGVLGLRHVNESGIGLLGIVIAWLYFAIMESGPRQATLGKMLLGLKVTTMNAERVTFARASARFVAKTVSGLIFYIGFLMAGWTRRKQGLHDLLTGCLVMKRRV